MSADALGDDDGEELADVLDGTRTGGYKGRRQRAQRAQQTAQPGPSGAAFTCTLCGVHADLRIFPGLLQSSLHPLGCHGIPYQVDAVLSTCRCLNPAVQD